MNLKDLISNTAAQHKEFGLLTEENLNSKLQQFALTNTHLTEYQARTEVLSQILNDSIGSLVETWTGK